MNKERKKDVAPKATNSKRFKKKSIIAKNRKRSYPKEKKLLDKQESDSAMEDSANKNANDMYTIFPKKLKYLRKMVFKQRQYKKSKDSLHLHTTPPIKASNNEARANDYLFRKYQKNS